MEQNAREEVEIDIYEIFQVLVSKLWLIMLMGILVGIVAFVYSKYVVAPVYSSTTKVYVLARQNAETNVTFTDLQTGSQLTKDYIELVKSRTVLNKVIEDLDLSQSVDTLSNMIDVTTQTDTRIITITVNSTDVYEAQKIADAVRTVASVHICEVMKLEAVNVIDEADLPIAPSSPNVTKNTIIGIMIGVVLAMAIIIIRHLLNDSIRTPDDVERYLELSVLASIPIKEDDSKRRKKRRKAELSLEDEDLFDDDDVDDDIEGYTGASAEEMKKYLNEYLKDSREEKAEDWKKYLDEK